MRWKPLWIFTLHIFYHQIMIYYFSRPSGDDKFIYLRKTQMYAEHDYETKKRLNWKYTNDDKRL